MAFDSGTVTLGNPTKKSDFDQLLSNLFSILNDPHTFKGTKTFNSGTVFTFAPTLPAGAIRAAEIDLGIDAGDVDGDVIPLGTAVTNSPTGGTSSTLPNTSFVRAALQEIFDRLKDLSGVQNDAVDSRHYAPGSIDEDHINWGSGTDQVDLDDVPESSTKKHLTTTVQSFTGDKTFDDDIILASGTAIKPSSDHYNSLVDSDTIFGWFTAVVPNTSDYSVIFGCIDHDLTGTRKTIACGYIKRIDAGTIRFYGTNVSAVTPSPDYIDIDDGDTTTENNVALAL